jgi:putative transposase
VHSAGVPDGTGGKQVLQRLFERIKGVSYNRHCRLSTIWADGAYEAIVGWVKLMLGWTLEIVRRPSDAQGWMVLPKRWIVERTFGWLGRYRRLSRDFEHTVQSSEAMVYIASIAQTGCQLTFRTLSKGFETRLDKGDTILSGDVSEALIPETGLKLYTRGP